MFSCVQDFLQERTFTVRLGNAVSRSFSQENGVPQGSVLSVTLFAIKINSLAKVIPRPVMYSLYVDDLQIAFSSCNQSVCERQIQTTVNRLQRWADENGFRFSPEKCACVCFTRKRGIHAKPEIKIRDMLVPVHSEHKFLGIIYDSKLTFGAHIKTLKMTCMRTLNILKILSHKSWGADRACLLRIYGSLVRSRLDYGCIVYGSARQSVLTSLDPVHNLGLRLASGAYRTSPVDSLYVECNEWPLQYRRAYLSGVYAAKIACINDHPCARELFENKYKKLYENKPRVVRPLALRLEEHMTLYSFKICPTTLLSFSDALAPWDYSAVKCDLSLLKYDKKAFPHQFLRQEFLALKDKYSSYCHYFTDGSKTAGHTGYAFVNSSAVTVAERIADEGSVFTAEVFGITSAIEDVIANGLQKVAIFTDSLSAIRALTSLVPSKNAAVGMLKNRLCCLTSAGVSVVFCWIPSHIGIPENETVDRAAYDTKHCAITKSKVPYQDLRNTIRKSITMYWQTEWDRQTENKLHLVKPYLSEWKSCRHRNRFYEVILCRLRIGHTVLTHGFLIQKEQKPVCDHCGDPLTVLHVLISCPHLEAARIRHFKALYTFCIPLHPALLLSDEPLVDFSNVFQFFEDAGLLHRF